ncbi:MAG: hypothetical protein JW726_11280 [Anaerolineales bacterium]|nr:hypothetical protein [Anaerolineales bacterium]
MLIDAYSNLALLMQILQAESEKEGLPWWLILLILAILIIILIWALTRNARFSEPPHVEHSHEEAAGHEATRSVVAESAVEVAEPAHVEPAVPPAPPVPDDLKIIEGIGPKIDSLLKEAGITTYAQLADTPAEKLRSLMEDANLRIADPASWPEQASLAAKGDMDGLKAMQDSLRGGRKTG